MRQEIQGRASVIRGLICVLLLVGLPASMASAQSLNDDSWSWLTEDSSAYLSGEIIIQFSYNELAVNVTGPRTRVSLFNEACETILSGSRIKRMLGQIVTDLAVVELPRHTSVQQAITRFSGKTGIRYAEPQYLIHATYTPNDVLFGDQWNLDNQGLTGGLPGADINAPEGWDINREAADIIVAVLDSGVDYNHPDLYDNMWFTEMWIPPDDANFTDPNSDDYVESEPPDPNFFFRDYGPDYIDGPTPDDPNDFNEDGDPDDQNFHGTHVAGIIGAVGDNEEGIAGVAHTVQLMAVRMLDANGMGTIDAAISGINYALSNDAQVINCSWVFGQFSNALFNAAQAAGQRGVTMVCAAGNENADNDSIPTYPSNFANPPFGLTPLDNIVGVMATNDFDQKAFFSNYGRNNVHIGAPGVNIWSCLPQTVTDAMTEAGLDEAGLYAPISGTSQAAPHVSGACVLALAMDGSLTPLQLRNRLIFYQSVDEVLPELCVSEGRLVLDKFLRLMLSGAVRNITQNIPYNTIQAAIDEAVDGDEIVARTDRVYAETIDFLGKDIVVRSGDPDNGPSYGASSPETTSISGIDAGETDSVVSFVSGETQSAVLRGFTVDGAPQRGVFIEGASASLSNCILYQNNNGGLSVSEGSASLTNTRIEKNESLDNGGGVLAMNDSTVNLFDCRIIDNTATRNGGGLYCRESTVSVQLSDIRDNESLDGRGGGVSAIDATLTLELSEVVDNEALLWEGGGVFCRGGEVVIKDCQINTNTSGFDGGGLFCDTDADLLLRNTELSANRARYYAGGLACVDTDDHVVIKNCLITDNIAEGLDGAGIYCDRSSPSITNVTLAGNDCLQYNRSGGAVFCIDNSAPVIRDTIFAHNNDIAVYVADASSRVDMAYCLFYGNNRPGDYSDTDVPLARLSDPNTAHLVPGDNLIHADPMFVRGRLGNFYLSQYAAGQILDVDGNVVTGDNSMDATSPAVNAGSDDAEALDMHRVSTRTDNLTDENGLKDAGRVDIGFHYNDFMQPVQYELTTATDPANEAGIEPAMGNEPLVYKQFAQVQVIARADDPNEYRLNAWQGTDDDTRVDRGADGRPVAVQTNIVTMDGDKDVVALFETITVMLRVAVTGQENGLQADVSPRRPIEVERGTTVQVEVRPYQNSARVVWKDISGPNPIPIYSTNRRINVEIEPPFAVNPDGDDIKIIQARLYIPNTIDVSSSVALEQAVTNAQDGDIIKLDTGVYRTNGGMLVANNITITGKDPSNPATVANTIIELNFNNTEAQAFTFIGSEPNTLLEGITFRNFLMGAQINTPRADGDWDPDTAQGPDGSSGQSVYGGAVVCQGASPTLRNLVFENCAAIGGWAGNGVDGDQDNPNAGHGGWPGYGGGGAIALLSGSDANMVDCAFNDCYAIGGIGGNGGGSMFGAVGIGGGWYSSPINPAGIDYISVSSGAGGAVFSDALSSPHFKRCRFENCWVQGGTMGVSGDNSFNNVNWGIPAAGGAVYLGGGGYFFVDDDEAGQPTLVDCVFVNNRTIDPNAPADAGLAQGTTTIKDPFTGFGGAVATAAGMKPTFVNCEFTNNRAPEGGAIHSDTSPAVIEGSAFTDNVAHRGGGVYLLDGRPTIRTSRFENNMATHDFTPFLRPIVIQNVPQSETFDPNVRVEAGEGGAIVSSDSDMSVIDSIVRDNQAESWGGGLEITGNSDVNLKNCLIVENQAGVNGGGIYGSWDVGMTIRSSTIADNRAVGSVGRGGGLFLSYHAYADIMDSIFWGNRSASDGQEISVEEGNSEYPQPGKVNITHSIVQPDPKDIEITKIDVAFVVDTTGSMGAEIAAVQTGMQEIINGIREEIADARIAIVDYQDYGLDYNDITDYGYHTVLPFTSDARRITAGVQVLELGNGGDVPETVYSALMHTIDPDGLEALLAADDPNLITEDSDGIGPWRDGADTLRLVILIADAPPKDPEPHTNYTLETVTDAFVNRMAPVKIFPVITGFGVGDPNVMSMLSALANGTGGTTSEAPESEELVETIIQAIAEAARPIHRVNSRTLDGIPGWDEDTGIWSVESKNLTQDPLFLQDYFLSQVSTGQAQDSPAVDSGSAHVNDPNVAFNDNHTTRIDGVADVNRVDLGFHYHNEAFMAKLSVTVVDEDGNPVAPDDVKGSFVGADRYYVIGSEVEVRAVPDPNYRTIWILEEEELEVKANTRTVELTGDTNLVVRFEPDLYRVDIRVVGDHGSVVPDSGIYYGGDFTLTAHPDEGYRVKAWSGTGQDPAWNQNELTIGLDSDRTITVEFEEDKTQYLAVPQEYETIEEAIAVAGGGDVQIVLDAQAHYIFNSPEGLDLQGKKIIITSREPNNPDVVASTIIDCRGGPGRPDDPNHPDYAAILDPQRAFHFHSGEGQDTIIRGVTIRNGWWRGPKGIDGRFGVLTPNPYELTDPTSDTSPPYAERGRNANGDGYGGAVLCENNSSPLFENCIIENCRVTGAFGGYGAWGQAGPSPQQDEWSFRPPDAEVDDDPETTTDGQWGGTGGDGIGNGYGGAIACLDQSSPRFVNTIFRNNRARGGQGGFGGDGGSPSNGVDPDWGTESNGGAGGDGYGDGFGGAVYCDPGSRLELVDCTFTNNIAVTGEPGEGGAVGQGNAMTPNPAAPGALGTAFPSGGIAGGAIYLEDANVLAEGCRFLRNSAHEDLNVEYVYEGITRIEPVFTYMRGGAVYAASDDLDSTARGLMFADCRFEENQAGTVYVESGYPVDVNGCFFNRNEYVAQSEPNFFSTDVTSIFTFTLNQATTSVTHQGAALFIDRDCPSVDIRHTQFYSNYAVGNGGAVRTLSSMNVESSLFGGNRTDGVGGGIDAYCQSDVPTQPIVLTLTFDQCLFGGNRATVSDLGYGGGVRFRHFDATFKDSHFFGNQAKSGGGLFLAKGKLRISGGSLRDNQAIGGSGINTRNVLNDTRLSQLGLVDDLNINIAYYDYASLGAIDITQGSCRGGALVAGASTDSVIEHCEITGNQALAANGEGGGVLFSGGGVDQIVKNCLFAENQSAGVGGALGCSAFAKPYITNSTFANNTAGRRGSAIHCDSDTTAVVGNSIFQNNDQTAIVERKAGAAEVTYSLFDDNPQGDYAVVEVDGSITRTRTGPELDGTNLAADPLFVTGEFGSFYLSSPDATDPNQSIQSPAIDAGSQSSAAAGLSGQTYTTHTDGKEDTGQVDLGFHFRNHTELPKARLTTSVDRGHGTISPQSGEFHAGTPVVLTATPESGWRVAGWSGTIEDISTATTNIVIMGLEDVHASVDFEQPRTLFVGSAHEYTTLQHAVDSARDGDTIIVQTNGPYRGITNDPQREWGFEMVEIENKALTITGAKPLDSEAVASTIFENVWFRITNSGPDLVIDGITFRNNAWDGGVTADGTPTVNDDGWWGLSLYGGAMQIINASPTIRNCVFQNCSITGGDAEPGDSGTQEHPIGFDGGWGGKAYGGAIYCGYNANPTFTNCSFTNCFVRGGNGSNGGNGTPGNRGGRGGMWELSQTIENRLAQTWWDGWQNGDKILGGISSDPYDASFDEYWMYSGYGGAVYCEFDSSPRFIGCQFRDNQTFGGVCGIGGTADPSPDRNLKMENAGGAVYARENCNVEFLDCVFANNTTDSTLDYIDTEGAPAVAGPSDDPYFSYGGSIAFEYDCRVTLQNCQVLDSDAGLGGGIYWSSSELNLIQGAIMDNTAIHGGGLFSVEAPGSLISGSTIMRNQAFLAETDPNLAADPNDPNETGTDSGRFGAGSGLSWGGGYCGLTSVVEIVDSTFSQNSATSSGGGLYFSGSDQSLASPVLHNSLILDNLAGRDGGGLSVNWHAEPTLTNCTILGNEVLGITGGGGGLFAAFDSNTVVRDSIIWDNRGFKGSQIALGSSSEKAPGSNPSTLRIDYSDIQLTQVQAESLKLDLVFCVDTTASMAPYLETLQADIEQILSGIRTQTEDYRIAVVDFRDINDLPFGDPNTDYPYRAVSPFTGNINTVRTAINSLSTGGQLDTAESVYSGVIGALNGSGIGQFRPGDDVRRVVLLIGDAVPQEPEPVTGNTLADVVTAAGVEPAKMVFTVPVGGSLITESAYNQISQGTGGAMSIALNEDQLTGAILEAIEVAFSEPEPVFVDVDNHLLGLIGEGTTWSADGTTNISADPQFAVGLYLSQIDSGQAIQSPAVDVGSRDANEVFPSMAYTTRTDGIPDTGRVDMGYHYGTGLEQYWLTVETLDEFGTVTPTRLAVVKGVDNPVVTITATPLPGYKVKQWTGTDDDDSIRTVNTVTVDQDRHVTVSFEPAPKYRFRTQVSGEGHGTLVVNGLEPDEDGWIQVDAATTVQLTAQPDAGYEVSQWNNTDDDTSTALTNTALIDANNMVISVTFAEATHTVISVPDDYGTVQEAVAAAAPGDTVVLSPGTYFGGGEGSVLLSLDKPITITSVNPEDPGTVTSTVLDGYNNDPERNFHYLGIVVYPTGGNGDIVINGITIRNCGGFVDADGADDGDRAAGHPDGYDGAVGFGPAMIVLPGAGPVVKNCVFEDNYIVASDGGDGVDGDGQNNAGRGGWGGWARGGAIYCADTSRPTFINCQILDNFAQGGNGGNGGNGSGNDGQDALPNYGGNYSPPSRTLIDANSLTETTADVDPWQIWLWDESIDYKYTFTEEAILDPNQQGLIEGQARESYLGDGSLYSAYGGGVYCGKASQVTFRDCVFSGNRTYGGYTGIGGIPDGSDRNIEPLYPRELPSFGGAVFCESDAHVNFAGCTFTNNTSSDPAGAAEIAGQVTVPDLADRATPYMGFGGGISAGIDARVTITDCNFVDNEADVGGGVHIKRSLIDVLDSEFEANAALLGGGLSGTDGDLVVSNSTFLRNQTVADVIDPNDDAVIPLGAGIHLSSSAALIMDSDFASNRTSGSAGAVFVQGNKPRIQNCLFRDNGAGRNGGAVVVGQSAVLTIRLSTFDRNLTDPNLLDSFADDVGYGGALYCRADTQTTVLDCIFRENTARFGGQFALRAADPFDGRCGTLKVDYSFMTNPPSAVYTECEPESLILGENMIYGRRPFFVADPERQDDPKYGYYLHPDSEAVDAGSVSASQLSMTAYTTSVDNTRDTGIVDMGYHYRLPEFCNVCDLVADGRIDFADFAALALQWLRQDCVAGSWCDGADVTFDGFVDGLDMETFSLCWLERDDTAPMPDPPRWDTEGDPNGTPRFNGSNVVMRAGPVEDGWWGRVGLEYYFDNVYGRGHDSGWITGNVYSDPVPTTTEGYSYRFKVRDKRRVVRFPDEIVREIDDKGVQWTWNETDWSVIRSAGEYINQPPVGPKNISLIQATSESLQILIDALSDPEGVEYEIEISLPGEDAFADSGWIEDDPADGQDGIVYTFGDLAPETTYRVRFRARDQSPEQLTTVYSAWQTFATLAPVETNPPIPNPMTWNVDADDDGYDGTPRVLPQAQAPRYTIVMRATPATDQEGSDPVQYYFESSDPTLSSGWIDSFEYEVYSQRSPGTWGITFRVRARDGNGNVTGWSPALVPGPGIQADGGGAGGQ